MSKNYLKKIIAQNPKDLQIIAALISESKAKVSDIKYLPKNKIFLLSIDRKEKENELQQPKEKLIQLHRIRKCS